MNQINIAVPVGYLEDRFLEETGEEYNPYINYAMDELEAKWAAEAEMKRVLGHDEITRYFDEDGELKVKLYVHSIYGDIYDGGELELGWIVSTSSYLY